MARAPARAFLVFALAAAGFAQDLHVGVKAGLPLTAYFDTGRMPNSEYSAATRRYTAGPTIELRFANRLGVEFDVLFKRTGYVAIVNAVAGGVSTTSALDLKAIPGISRSFSSTACKAASGRTSRQAR